MYHPYFRGKQNELITVRDNAELLSEAGFIPIIEPVKEVIRGLDRSLNAVCNAGGNAIVIVNPHHGELTENGNNISTLLRENYIDNDCVKVGILLKSNTSLNRAIELRNAHDAHPITFIHAGFTEGRALAERLGGSMRQTHHVFLEPDCGRLYRNHFAEAERVLIRDGFEKRRNKDHPTVEPFSDLHVTFDAEGMNGFGDFLTVGDEFSESGGPAYAVAIHLTYIDDDNDNAMFIHHFKSIRQNTPTDPAGKFAEALDAMIASLDSPNSKVFDTNAVNEFRQLHRDQHFPGLGYVKKLSMQHHIETLARFFGD